MLPGYLATWLPDYLATWLPGYLATWPPDYLATLLPGYLTTWLPGCLVDVFGLHEQLSVGSVWEGGGNDRYSSIRPPATRQKEQ